jgi:hypothetical protein
MCDITGSITAQRASPKQFNMAENGDSTEGIL